MNSLLKKTLSLIIMTVVLSAVLTALVFRLTGTAAYADIKKGELIPRAFYLADITANFMQGFISKYDYEQAVNTDRKIWDAEPYIYSSDGSLIAHSTRGDLENNKAAIAKVISEVLLGDTVSTFTLKNGSGVLVGVPVYNVYGAIIGAVFLVKPLQELNTTLASLIWALMIAMLLVMVIMILPAYIVSKRLTGPLKIMNSSALAMARGDFSVRAIEKGRDEIAQLGRSLNALSGALSVTINELTFERNRLRSVLNGLGEGVIAVNEKGGIMQYNPAALMLMGSEEGELNASEVYRSIQEDIEVVLSGGEEKRIVQRKRRDMVLHITVSVLSDEEREVEGALILVQDETEAVRLEQTRRDYVANVSHELRTPLAAIRGLSDALCDGLIKKEDDKVRYYGYIQKETIRLSRLIDDLLELSRLQSGTIALTKQRMEVDELLADVAERYDQTAREHGFSIKLDVPDDCPLAYSNPDRVEQVLIALLDNAIKHNEGAGAIALSASEREDSMLVSVTNGGAISEEDIGHIFERFYKADRAHSGEGTGLGLSISKEIMDLLGERIWAKSENGRVTFAFTLEKYHSCVEKANIEQNRQENATNADSGVI